MALSYSQTGAAGGTFLVIYDGEDNDDATVQAAGLQNFDLTNGGTAALGECQQFPAEYFHHRRFRTRNLSELTLTAPATAIPAGLTFMFSDFTVSQGTGADFSNLGAIMLFVNTGNPPGWPLALELGSFETTDTNQPETVLQGQMVNVVSSSIIASNFPGDNPFDAEVAEEITVPPGETWVLTGFEWQGNYNPGVPSGATANIGIRMDDNGALGNELIRIDDVLLEIINNVISPDSYVPLRLEGGNTYWVFFSANTPIGTEHNVLESTDTFWRPYFWQNPGNAFGTGCTSNTPGNQCGGTESSLAMTFKGQVETPPLAPKLELEKTVAKNGPGSDIHVGRLSPSRCGIPVPTRQETLWYVMIFFSGLETVLRESVESPCQLVEIKNSAGRTTREKVECAYTALGPDEERVITIDVIPTLGAEDGFPTFFGSNIAVAEDRATQRQLAFAEVKYTVEPNLMYFFILVFKANKAKNVAAKLNATTSLDLYVDSVRVAEDLPELSGARIPVSIGRTAPVIDLVEGADPDNSTPLASFTVDFVTEETGSRAFSPSNRFVVANAPNDSLTLLVKQNARSKWPSA